MRKGRVAPPRPMADRIKEAVRLLLTVYENQVAHLTTEERDEVMAEVHLGMDESNHLWKEKEQEWLQKQKNKS
jgi:hypothetical protein